MMTEVTDDVIASAENQASTANCSCKANNNVTKNVYIRKYLFVF